jgi:lipopolysaccharide export system protein LptA
MAYGAACALVAALALSPPCARAQTPIGGFSGLSSGDSKKPIDIESDRLEVDDKKHMATFIGNVSATQGDNNLKAPRLEVFYEKADQPQAADTRQQAAKPAKPVKTASADTASSPASGQIKRIHATGGKVVVTSTKDQQEATGDDAVFDVKAQQITMTGKEVALSQGGSKVKGTKLVIDLKTGQANLVTSEPGPGEAASAKPRVRAVFQQEKGPDGKQVNPFADKSDKKKNAGAAPPPARKPTPPQQNATPGPDWQPQSR